MTKLKDLNYHDGVVSNLEPDILECEDQVSLKKLCFKQSQWKGWNSSWAISKSRRWCFKVMHSIVCVTQHWSQDWKRSVFIPILKKSNANECWNYLTIVLILTILCSTCFKLVFMNTWSRNSRCTSWISNWQRNQSSSCQHLLDHRESNGVPEKHLLLLQWLR